MSVICLLIEWLGSEGYVQEKRREIWGGVLIQS